MPDRDANSPALCCYRCGESLAALSLPLARLDLCPACGVELHVCRMCVNYAPRLPDACTEDDAIVVRDKATANFCDYFSPRAGAFDGREKRAEDAARQQLDALFGGSAKATAQEGTAGSDSGSGKPSPGLLDEAEKLFSK